MRYRTIGFFLVFLSPLFAFLFLYLLMTRPYFPNGTNYLTPIIEHTIFNLFIIGVQVSGLTIYYVGYKRKEEKSGAFPFFYGLSGVFIILGLVTVYAAYFFYYGELIPWSMEPGVRAITMWDRAEHVTWAIAGILWIISGGIFLTF